MNSLLALAAVGSWTYAGFLAEPTPPAPKLSEVSAPGRRIVPAVEGPRAEKPDAKRPKPEAPSPSKAIPAETPPRYCLADRSGQYWEHADPDYLRKFVDERNLSFHTRPDPSARSSRPVDDWGH